MALDKQELKLLLTELKKVFATKKELEEMKTYTETYGSVLHAAREFFDLFNKCRKENEKSYR